MNEYHFHIDILHLFDFYSTCTWSFCYMTTGTAPVTRILSFVN